MILQGIKERGFENDWRAISDDLGSKFNYMMGVCPNYSMGVTLSDLFIGFLEEIDPRTEGLGIDEQLMDYDGIKEKYFFNDEKVNNLESKIEELLTREGKPAEGPVSGDFEGRMNIFSKEISKMIGLFGVYSKWEEITGRFASICRIHEKGIIQGLASVGYCYVSIPRMIEETKEMIEKGEKIEGATVVGVDKIPETDEEMGRVMEGMRKMEEEKKKEKENRDLMYS